MPKLYLLRHAQAASSLSLEDKDRPITAHGIAQSKEIGGHIKDINIALCSPARRTRQTLKEAIKTSDNGIKKIETPNILYNAMASEILNTIQSFGEKNILVVAHNPGIHQLAKMLVSEGDPAQLERLNLFYNPATLAIFECPCDAWTEIKQHKNKLLDLIIPE